MYSFNKKRSNEDKMTIKLEPFRKWAVYLWDKFKNISQLSEQRVVMAHLTGKDVVIHLEFTNQTSRSKIVELIRKKLTLLN